MEMDLNKIAKVTARAVEQVCLSENGPCVSFSLLFFDLVDKCYKFKTYLSFPKDMLDEDQVKELNTAFDYIQRRVGEIMAGDVKDAEDLKKEETLQ